MVPQRVRQGQRGIHAARLLWISCVAADHPRALRRKGLFDAETGLGFFRSWGRSRFIGEERRRARRSMSASGSDRMARAFWPVSIPAATGRILKPISVSRCRRIRPTRSLRSCRRRSVICNRNCSETEQSGQAVDQKDVQEFHRPAQRARSPRQSPAGPRP